MKVGRRETGKMEVVSWKVTGEEIQEWKDRKLQLQGTVCRSKKSRGGRLRLCLQHKQTELI